MKKSKLQPITVEDIKEFVKLRIGHCQENAGDDVMCDPDCSDDSGGFYDYAVAIDTLEDILEFITTNGFREIK